MAAPRGGSYAYAISNLAYGNLRSTEIAVAPNTEYELYAWLRGELDAEASEGGGWLVRAVFYDASGVQLGYQDVGVGAAGSLNTTWAQKGGRFITPAGAARLRVAFYNYLNSGWAAFDDAR